MLRTPILLASRNPLIRAMVAHAPLSRSVVRRFVAGETVDDAVRTTDRLGREGLLVSLDHLGEDTAREDQAIATTQAYLTLLGLLGAAGLTPGAEVSVKLTAVGQLLDEGLAYANAATICAAAAVAGTTVTLDMEDHTTTDSTLDVLARLRVEHPATGAVIQSYLHRSLQDCKDLATPGSRVRLCKGAYAEPDTVAFHGVDAVSRSYARCLGVLMAGAGYPMVATHDPRLVELGKALADHHGRRPDTYEFQMLYGVRPEEQHRLAAAGHRVRVYVPYGDEWYGYLVRRLAERPANLAFFLRALASKS